MMTMETLCLESRGGVAALRGRQCRQQGNLINANMEMVRPRVLGTA